MGTASSGRYPVIQLKKGRQRVDMGVGLREVEEGEAAFRMYCMREK